MPQNDIVSFDVFLLQEPKKAIEPKKLEDLMEKQEPKETLIEPKELEEAMEKQEPKEALVEPKKLEEVMEQQEATPNIPQEIFSADDMLVEAAASRSNLKSMVILNLRPSGRV